MRPASETLGVALVTLGLAAAASFAAAAQPLVVDVQGRPLYEPGVVAVKLRAEAAAAVKVLPRRLGIPELDAGMRRLGVTRVEPMFRVRLAKARPDLPDCGRDDGAIGG